MKRGDSGMTLMELLVVISILGLLVTVMLPFQGRMADDTKKKETIQLFESIRFGLLGAENAYDANGNRVLGGYVGDYGTLPDFVVHEWDTSTHSLVIPEDTSNPNKPTVMDWEDSANHNEHDYNIMPLNLWTNIIRVDGVTAPQEFMEHADWNGPYVVPPRDDTKGDDDLYSSTAAAGSSEARHFLLRQGDGRLLDGWGSAIHIYFDDNKNLYFVSAGSDRRITFGDESSVATPNFGPADLTLPHNDDNIVLMISHEQWNLTDQKIATTRQQLKDIKSALLGRYGSVTGGVNQPNGFIADMGSFETLTGSYVRNGGTVYQCVDSHTASGSFTISSAWKAVTGGSTGKVETDFPFAGEWISGREYHAARPQLLAINGDYVKVETPPSSGEYTYYRCVKDNTATGQSPTNNPDMWIKDDTFKEHDWVPEYASGTLYKQELLPSWEYYTNVQFGVGWRGPYTLYADMPMTDAWGEEIQLELDDAGGLIIRSKGVDKISNTVDDIIENIRRSDYAVPATVVVKPGTITMTTDDFVAAYTAFNGKVAYIAAKNQALATSDGQFLFTEPDAYEAIVPKEIAKGDTITIRTFYPTSMIGNWYDSSASPAKHATWLPIGRVSIVYQNSAGASLSIGNQETFILHPRTTPQLILGD